MLPRIFGNQARLPTVITHLAMDAPFRRHGLAKTLPNGFLIERQNVMRLTDYRALYAAVGRAWHWVNRRDLTDRELAAVIHHPRTEIFVLRHGAQNIGFAEFNLLNFPEADIVFVGLIDRYIGYGLGSALLARVLDYLFQSSVRRIIIQTCTLDHPSALHLYQKAGFSPYDREKTFIIDKAG